MRLATRFTPLAAACCALAMAACSGDTGASDSAAAQSDTSRARTISLADVAGKWSLRAVPESGDTTVTNYVLTATADTTGWSLTFPGGAPIPARVRVDGDSIMIDAGPYDSVRRTGLKVVTNAVARVQGNSLTGTSVAHYATTAADSVLRLRITGTRNP